MYALNIWIYMNYIWIYVWIENMDREYTYMHGLRIWTGSIYVGIEVMG